MKIAARRGKADEAPGGGAQEILVFRAQHVCLCLRATGGIGHGVVPKVPGSGLGGQATLHSAQFTTAADHGFGEGTRVLVAGFGNSAIEQTYDLVDAKCEVTKFCCGFTHRNRDDLNVHPSDLSPSDR